jgi:quercetin dioxygenase-like cupin family protein
MVHIVMKPGSVIPAHTHEGMAEALYVMRGDFINEGKEYLPGTSLHVKAGKQHGPHSTKKGCSVLVLWTDKAATGDADLTDFVSPSTLTEQARLLNLTQYGSARSPIHESNSHAYARRS